MVRLEVKNTWYMRTDSVRATPKAKPAASQNISKGSVFRTADRHFELYYKLDPKADHFPYTVPFVARAAKTVLFVTGPDCIPPVQF